MIGEIDLKILSLIQRSARTPNAEVARQVEMAPSAVFARTRKKEERHLPLAEQAEGPRRFRVA